MTIHDYEDHHSPDRRDCKIGLPPRDGETILAGFCWVSRARWSGLAANAAYPASLGAE